MRSSYSPAAFAKSGNKIRLQEQPFQVLRVLLERPGDIVTREELRHGLWADETFGDFEHGLNSAVRKLREALGDSAESPRFVETLPKRGYRFITSVETARPSHTGSRPRRLQRRHAVLLGVATALVLLLIVSPGRLRDRILPGAPRASIRALAVMPFGNLSKDADQEYFADGVTDALITELGRIGALRVISRQSVVQYKAVKKPLPEITRELKVDAVIEGTVLRAERELKQAIELNPSLYEARSNYALVLGSLRRAEEATEQLRIARQINPIHPVAGCLVGWCSYISGQYEKGAGQLRNAVEMGRGFFIAHWFLWRALHRTGEDAAASKECKRMYELLGDAEVVRALDRGDSYQGGMREAAETLVGRSRTAYVPGTQVALLYAHAGQNDRAVEWLEKAYEEGDPRLHFLWADPDWEELYSEPRFQDLLRKMGFPSVEPVAAWARPK